MSRERERGKKKGSLYVIDSPCPARKKSGVFFSLNGSNKIKKSRKMTRRKCPQNGRLADGRLCFLLKVSRGGLNGSFQLCATFFRACLLTIEKS